MPQDSNKSENNNQNVSALPNLTVGARRSAKKNLNIPKENIVQTFSAPIIATLIKASQDNTHSQNILENFAKNIGQAIKSSLDKPAKLTEIVKQANEILEKAKSNVEALDKAIENAKTELNNAQYDKENKEALRKAIEQARDASAATKLIIKSKEKQITGLTNKLPKLEVALKNHNSAINNMVAFQHKLSDVKADLAKQKEILSEGKQHLGNANNSLGSLSNAIVEAQADGHKPIRVYQAEVIVEDSHRTISEFHESLTNFEKSLSIQIEEKIKIEQPHPIDVTATIVEPLNIARAANKEALQKLVDATLLQPVDKQTLESNLQNRIALLAKAKEACASLSAAIANAEKAKVDAETESQPFDKDTVENTLSDAQQELEVTRQAIKQHEELITFQEASNPSVLEAYQNDVLLTESINAQYAQFVEALKNPDNNNKSDQHFAEIHRLYAEIENNNRALTGAMQKAEQEVGKYPSNELIETSFFHIAQLARRVGDHAKQISENIVPLSNQYATLKNAMQGDLNAQAKLNQAETAFETAKKQIELHPDNQENKTNFNATQEQLQDAVRKVAISLDNLRQAIKSSEEKKLPQLDPLLGNAKKQFTNSSEAKKRSAPIINSKVEEIKIEKDDDDDFSKKPLPLPPSEQKAITENVTRKKLVETLKQKNTHIEVLKKLQPLLLSPIKQEIKNSLINASLQRLHDARATLRTLTEIVAEAEENVIDVTEAKEQAEDFKKEIDAFQDSLTIFQDTPLEIHLENEDEFEVKKDNPEQDKKDKLDVPKIKSDKLSIVLTEIENVLNDYDKYFKTLQTELPKQLESLKATINEANQIYSIEHLTPDLEKNKDEILARLKRKNIMLNNIQEQFDAIITKNGHLAQINKQLEKISDDIYEKQDVYFANELKEHSMGLQNSFKKNYLLENHPNFELRSTLSAAQTETDKAIAFLSSDAIANKVSYDVIPEHVYNAETQTFTSHFIVASPEFKNTQDIKLGIGDLGYKKTKVETHPKPNKDDVNEIKENRQNGSILEFAIPQDVLLDDKEKLQITINMMLDAIKSNPIDNKDNKLYIASTDESYLKNCTMIAKVLQLSEDELDVQLIKNGPEGEFEEPYSAKVSEIYTNIKTHDTGNFDRIKYEQIQGNLRAHKISYDLPAANIIDNNKSAMTAYSLREVRSNLADAEKIEQRKVERKRTFSPPTNLMAQASNALNEQSLDKVKSHGLFQAGEDKAKPIDVRESIKKAAEINEKAKSETINIENEIEEHTHPKLR